MNPIILFLFIFLAVMTGLTIALRRRKNIPKQPRAIQKQQRQMLWWIIPIWLFQILLAFKQHSIAGMLLFGGIIVLNIMMAMRKPNRSEEIRNYREDPTKCGRCEYDLTGNVSGVCPECGWAFPAADVVVESPQWVGWWKKWRIDYLDDWRRTLISSSLAMLFCIICGAYAFLSEWPFALIVGLGVVMMLINVIRIIQYALRATDAN